jgi:signal peptidase I
MQSDDYRDPQAAEAVLDGPAAASEPNPSAAPPAQPELESPFTMSAETATRFEMPSDEAFEFPTIPTPLTLPFEPTPSVAPAVAEPPAEVRPSTWVRLGHEVVAAVQTLVSAAVYATLIVTFGFQVARVDGLSMAPTLEDHDRLIVNKLVYELGDPLPGDIVMLYYPLNPEKMFVKRVIAREGDTVRIVDGRVYVNDVPLHDDYVPQEFRSHDDWGPQVIQQGYYFVMGDHRNNSSDSRHWGPVPKKYIVGKVKVRWWPLQDAKIF